MTTIDVRLTADQLAELLDVLELSIYPFRYFGRDDATYNTLADRAEDIAKVLRAVWHDEVDR